MPDILHSLNEAEQFRTFTSLVYATDIDDILEDNDEFTIFAPTDAAFAKLPVGAIEALVADDIPRLRNILLYHIAPGVYTAEDLEDSTEITTLQGETLGMRLTEGMDVNIASFTETDIEADNGVIHAIDTVLLPRSEVLAHG